MSDFDIKSTLECVPSQTYIEVNFKNRGGYPIHIRFTDKDVSVIGDYGCWVFPTGSSVGTTLTPVIGQRS